MKSKTKIQATRTKKKIKNKSNANNERNKESNFPIVGIGASAGGLEALEQFFENLPEDNNMAFVVIQHLDSTHTSMLPKLLQRATLMEVSQVTDNLRVKPNCVYVIPPNKTMSVLNGVLHLFDPVQTRGLRLPIDIFLSSLALDMQEKSIGIILSGMGSDGSRGIKSIKEKGGFVLVQDPLSAKYDSMPQNAIKTVVADIVAPANQLPSKLMELLKFIPAIQLKLDTEIDKNSLNDLDKIIILLREQSGHDFSMYKKNTLLRRIERRKAVHKIDKLQTYTHLLQINPEEVNILFNELLIGVTNFFRDNAVWNLIKEKTIPAYIKELPEGYVLRAWVPACSTGEEAYTLAIVLKEIIEKDNNPKNISLQIFATDIDSEAIKKARRGVFPSSITADVAPELIKKYFTQVQEGYSVKSAIREMLVFAIQDIIKDPPFTKIDILSCRNMLIYMEQLLQDKLMVLFHYCLVPKGVLILGSAETTGKKKDLFEDIDLKLKIYKKTRTTIPEQNTFTNYFQHNIIVTPKIKPVTKPTENIQTIADQILLQNFSPPSVLINNKGDIIYITGRTGKYLEPLAGKANWNIYAMAREGLRQKLPGALRKAMQNFNIVSLRNIKIITNNGTQTFNLTIQQLEKPETVNGMLLLVFIDIPTIEAKTASLTKKGNQKTEDKEIELEVELQRTQEDLQNIREEMQASQEELMLSNEELQSTNEELQSTNEELTTSKEEMQSLNEELQTVNIELQKNATDFARESDDIKNMLNSTSIATLFVDKELNIRRFTDPVSKIFKLRTTDIGRPFTELVNDLQYTEMESAARSVLKTLTSIEIPVSSLSGKWYDIKILPYRTLDDHIDGLVITFTDITKNKKTEAELKQINENIKNDEDKRYNMLLESTKDGILILDEESGKIKEVNQFLINFLGYSKDQLIEKPIWEIKTFENIITNKKHFLELREKELIRSEDLPLETATGRKINVVFTRTVFTIGKQKVIQCLIHDITDKKRIEEALAIAESKRKQLFETSKIGILILDAENGKIMEINPFLTEMLGHQKENFLDKMLWEIGFFKDIVSNKTKFAELLQKEFARFENILLEKTEGEKINVELVSNMYLVDNKKIILCLIHNNTK